MGGVIEQSDRVGRGFGDTLPQFREFDCLVSKGLGHSMHGSGSRLDRQTTLFGTRLDQQRKPRKIGHGYRALHKCGGIATLWSGRGNDQACCPSLASDVEAPNYFSAFRDYCFSQSQLFFLALSFNDCFDFSTLGLIFFPLHDIYITPPALC